MKSIHWVTLPQLEKVFLATKASLLWASTGARAKFESGRRAPISSDRVSNFFSHEALMPRRAAPVTQAAIARALRAVEQTGVRVAIEISPDGTIRLVPDREFLQSEGGARNASGYVEAQIAAAPWVKSR